MESSSDHERRFKGGADRLRSPERLAMLEVPRVVELCLAGRSLISVLDLGTGTGVFAEAFAARAMKVAGVDANAKLLEATRRLLPSIEFVEARAESLPFPDRSFDLLFLGLLLHEADDPLAVLREARRTVRDRVAILEWPYREGPYGPSLAHRLQEGIIAELAREAGFPRLELIRLSNMDLFLLDAR
jgi:ubiquinone/menaquinone biosynthesis C-methylase UbiE